MRKRIIIIFAVMAAMSLEAYTQNIYIYFNNGSSQNYALSDVRKMEFSETEMYLSLNDGNVLTWQLANVKKYTYSMSTKVEVPSEELNQDVLVYPNPVKEKLNISYQVNQTGNVDVSLYDLNGRLLETVLSENQNKGQHEIYWENTVLPAGTYLLKIQTASFKSVKKIIIVE